MSKVTITKSKLDNLANAVSAKSGEPVLLTVDEMTDAVLGINTGGEENVLEGVKVAGRELPIVDKKVNIPAATQTQAGVMTPQLMSEISDALDNFLESSVTNSEGDCFSINLGGNGTTTAGIYTSFLYDNGTRAANPLTIFGDGSTGKITTSIYGVITPTTDDMAANKKYVDDSINGISIPTKTSDLTNDSGFLTSSDIAAVLKYKGTKASYSALPSTGNTTGDVWHVTDTGAEYAWDGSTWQELGTAIDLSNYATKATTLSGYGITDAKIQNGTITLGSNTITPLTSYTETDPTVPSWAKASSKPSYALSEITSADDVKAIEALTGTAGLLRKTAANTWSLDTNTYLTSYTETDPTVPSWAKQSTKPSYTAAEVGALPDTTEIPSKTSDLTNDSGFITGYTETDPVFAASPAAGITSTDITNWNNKVSDDKTWNGVELVKQQVVSTSDSTYVPLSTSVNPLNMSFTLLKRTPTANAIAKYDSSAYLNSTTPSANDNSTKVATTAYVDAAIPTVPTNVSSFTNDAGYLTLATLPIYDGTVV